MLAARVDNLAGSIAALRVDQDAKHKENRVSIHDLRNNDQVIMDLLHKIDLKFARMVGYCAGAGAATALLAQFIDHIWR